LGSSAGSGAGTAGAVGGVGVGGGGAGSGNGAPAQATSVATIAATVVRCNFMWVIVLEALGALALLLLIVWWTMFSGRSKGERRDDDQ
jgi:hypothetical protein